MDKRAWGAIVIVMSIIAASWTAFALLETKDGAKALIEAHNDNIEAHEKLITQIVIPESVKAAINEWEKRRGRGR